MQCLERFMVIICSGITNTTFNLLVCCGDEFSRSEDGNSEVDVPEIRDHSLHRSVVSKR